MGIGTAIVMSVGMFCGTLLLIVSACLWFAYKYAKNVKVKVHKDIEVNVDEQSVVG